MNVFRVYPGRIFNHVFKLTVLVAIICVLSIVSSATTFADGHEMEEKPKVTGWFQLDVDNLGTYFLIGASHPIGGVSLASTVLLKGHYGEFDMGVSFPVVQSDNLTLILQPMLGVGFDYEITDAKVADGPDAIFPQFFAFLPAGRIFGFHWTIGTVRTLFDSERWDDIYNRTYVTYALNDTVAIGPQLETVIGLGDDAGVWATNFGARLNIGYGENNTLGLYLGYDTGREEGETGLTGRMNFTRRW